MSALFIGIDVGTSGAKAALVDARGVLHATHVSAYPLSHPREGWAEQDPEAWWNAVAECTRVLASGTDDVRGIAFAGQMLSLVAVDARGAPARPAIVWMDTRASEQAKRLIRRFGGPRVLARLAGGTPTAKDLAPKIAWIEEHEPDVMRRTDALTDATGYLVGRATGRVCIDPTAAGATGFFDARRRAWSRWLARAAGFPLEKMPRVVECASIAGTLTDEAARALGLPPGLPVAAGLADVPSAAIGSGAARAGEAHVYLGTSAWIGATVARPRAVPRAGIASVPAAAPGTCLMIGESETAGACRDWLEGALGCPPDEIERLLARTAPGAAGALFAPWLIGERAPLPDPSLRGAFVGLSLAHDRSHLVRAVHEGVALNLRWILDEHASAGVPCPTLRAIGGGAMSDAWLEILADATERPIERVAEPRHAGAIGCALIAAVAVGALPDVASIARTVRVERRFEPRPSHAAVYRGALARLRAIAPALRRLAAVDGDHP